MRRRSGGGGLWLGYALLTLLLIVWGALGFGFGVGWAVTAPVCADPVATPWVLLLAWP